MSSRPLASKIYKSKLLSKDPSLKAYLPDICSLTTNGWLLLLKKFPINYIKPEYGTGGRDVFRIKNIFFKNKSNGGEKKGDLLKNNPEHTKEYYLIEFGRKRHYIFQLEKMIQWAKNLLEKEKYVIQQGISLLTYKNLLFDSRFMAQANPSGQMTITGFTGRTACPGKITTNCSQGGKIVPLNLLFEAQGLRKDQYSQLLEKTKKISQKAINLFHKKHPRVNELGLDIGWDKNYHPWILEINTRPRIKPFSELPDKTFINRFYQYRRFYPSQSSETSPHRRGRRKTPKSPA